MDTGTIVETIIGAVEAIFALLIALGIKKGKK